MKYKGRKVFEYLVDIFGLDSRYIYNRNSYFYINTTHIYSVCILYKFYFLVVPTKKTAYFTTVNIE